MHVTPEEPRGLPEQLLPLPSLLRASGLTNSCIWVVVLRFISFHLPCVLRVFLPKLLLFWSLQDPLNSSKSGMPFTSQGGCPGIRQIPPAGLGKDFLGEK